MSEGTLDSGDWAVFRIFLAELEDPEFEKVYEQLEKEAVARAECDKDPTRLLFSSMTSDDLSSAREQMVAERRARIEDRRHCGLEKPAGSTMPTVSEDVRVDEKHDAAQRQNSLACAGQQSDECEDRSGSCGPKEKPNNMATFIITDDNNITAFANSVEAGQAGNSAESMFDSQAAFARLSAEWPLSRLVDIYNSIPGNVAVKKFADRKKAAARIWKAVQPLAGDIEVGLPVQPRSKKGKASKPAKPAKKTSAGDTAKPVKGNNNIEHRSKKAVVTAMMQRAKGATLTEIMRVTGWQAHTVRGMISILANKGGENIESSKNSAGERTYKITK
jgi:hypothetical protein